MSVTIDTETVLIFNLMYQVQPSSVFMVAKADKVIK